MDTFSLESNHGPPAFSAKQSKSHFVILIFTILPKKAAEKAVSQMRQESNLKVKTC